MIGLTETCESINCRTLSGWNKPRERLFDSNVSAQEWLCVSPEPVTDGDPEPHLTAIQVLRGYKFLQQRAE